MGVRLAWARLESARAGAAAWCRCRRGDRVAARAGSGLWKARKPLPELHKLARCRALALCIHAHQSAHCRYHGHSSSNSLPVAGLCRQGRVAQVRTLIESGADIDAVDHNGSTALMHAAETKKVGQAAAQWWVWASECLAVV